MAVSLVPDDHSSLKKQVHTEQDEYSALSSRQIEQVYIRSRPSTVTASQHTIHQHG